MEWEREKAPERLRLVEPESEPAETSAALMAAPERAQWRVVPGSTFSVVMEEVRGSPSCSEEELKRME